MFGCFLSLFTVLLTNYKSIVSITHEQNIICSKTLICRQLFAGHVVGFWPIKKREKMYHTYIHTYIHNLFDNAGQIKGNLQADVDLPYNKSKIT